GEVRAWRATTPGMVAGDVRFRSRKADLYADMPRVSAVQRRSLRSPTACRVKRVHATCCGFLILRMSSSRNRENDMRCSDMHAGLAQPFLEERAARAVGIRHGDLPVAVRPRFELLQSCERGGSFFLPAELPEGGEQDAQGQKTIGPSAERL